MLQGQIEPFHGLFENDNALDVKISNNPSIRPQIPFRNKPGGKKLSKLIKTNWNHDPKNRQNFSAIVKELEGICREIIPSKSKSDKTEERPSDISKSNRDSKRESQKLKNI